MAPTRTVHLQLGSSRCTRMESRVASNCLQLTYLDPLWLWRLVISLMDPELPHWTCHHHPRPHITNLDTTNFPRHQLDTVEDPSSTLRYHKSDFEHHTTHRFLGAASNHGARQLLCKQDRGDEA